VTILKILVVEDDRLVADALKSTLSHCNYAVEIADDGRTGLQLIESFSYDLLLLDVMLPKLDGISICRHVRSQGYAMPILMLTAIDGDRALGLDAGADDYAIKPFNPEDLRARIRALLRRSKDTAQPILTWEHLTLDPRNCEVTYEGKSIALTPKEYALLELLLRHNRQVFSCGAILEHLWTYQDAPSEEAVRTHIKGLRYKLRMAGAPADLVETVYGIGYRLKRIADRIGVGTNKVAIRPEPQPVTPVDSLTTFDVPQRLAEIWDRHRGHMFERVEDIERAISALETGSLDVEIRKKAWHSAHNLAGALGTFGLPLGSKVAKQIELILGSETDINPAQIVQLQTGVAVLWDEIESRVGAEIVTESIEVPNIEVRLSIVTEDLTTISALQTAAPDNFRIEISAGVAAHRATHQPHLIILDLDCFANLSDGLTALTELDRYYPSIPTIVLSELESLDRRIEVARRGGRLFLAKPISAESILLACDRILQQVNVTHAKVTIVDDDRALLEGLTALLSPWGIAVTTLAEPSQFWETLEASVPDLLILDLDMPTHDGIELCRAVRTDERWATLPIMFLTASTAAKAIDRVFAAGADDFATKPIDGSAFAARIIHRLERIERNAVVLQSY
jgi:DNA-binding response OmpR family regulator/HPt (histidine-containing phosphotransfer) domain-containing protein